MFSLVDSTTIWVSKKNFLKIYFDAQKISLFFENTIANADDQEEFPNFFLKKIQTKFQQEVRQLRRLMHETKKIGRPLQTSGDVHTLFINFLCQNLSAF